MSEIEVDENVPTNRLQNSMPHKNTHRRFPTVESYVKELGSDKSIVIEKVLIANNGVAAVKAIRSIRRWAYEVFGNERAIKFVVMATPEDLRANAEYIRMGDVIVDVPGGSNNHNYANVTLIVELARLHGVHAVWAGWGHASENPTLPDNLAKSTPPIKFIGPAGPPMRALGDKIGSTIIAQSAGVSCIAWNGDNVRATYDKETGSLPDKAFADACIHTATEAEEAAARVGFPIMIKASEGGGGKGIRRVDSPQEVANAYRQVCGEVPGSPIFIMKLSSNSRHLEVQLLADEYGEAVALNGRDCSVQRRHQKIIEEGPPVAAKPEVWTEMEKAAVALAKAVHYTNAGTVEYLYSESEARFYFLELNPRLQVEHPVTEMVTGVNLPAAQLQVAMGLPLRNIPEIRELYGKNRFEDDPKSSASIIDFDRTERVAPNGHCIAVRITAENAEAGFKPTSGGIQELNFRSTPSVWGYFSMDSSGSIHEFADSQFGHLFASGQDREQARRNMVLALKELSIRGDISTTVDYVSKLIELDDFVSNQIDTGWLDGIIKDNVDGMGTAFKLRRQSSATMNTVGSHLSVVLGASVKAYSCTVEDEKMFVDLLEKGQLPSRSLIRTKLEIELILNGVKYILRSDRVGPSSFALSVAYDASAKCVLVNVRQLSDGGYLIDIGGESHVAYMTRVGDAATGMRINVGGSSIVFSPDYDPTALRTDVAGKLVKKLKSDGAHVKKGETYCEIEVMKMFMPLKVEESGVLTWNMNEGAVLSAGNLLATLELDNPENVAAVTTFQGDLQVIGWGNSGSSTDRKRPHLTLRSALERLADGLNGFQLSPESIETSWTNLGLVVVDPMLPVFEVQEQLSVLSGRISISLFDKISVSLSEFSQGSQAKAKSGVPLRFPGREILALLDAESNKMTAEEQAAFDTLTEPLRASVEPYALAGVSSVPGSERVLVQFMLMLRTWVSNERWFHEAPSFADAVDALRKAHKNVPEKVLSVCRAHEALSTTSDIVARIISAVGDGTRVDLETSSVAALGKRVSIVAGARSLAEAMPVISEIGSMGGTDSYAELALKARKLLMQESFPSLEQRRQRVLAAAESLGSNGDLAREAEDLLADHIPMSDVFFPLLCSIESSKDKLGLLELFVRHLYRPYTMKDFKQMGPEGMVKFSFTNKPSESAIDVGTSVNSMTELSRIASSGSMRNLAADESEKASAIASGPKEKIPQTTLRTGVCVVLKEIDDLEDKSVVQKALEQFPQFGASIVEADAGPVNVLYFFITAEKTSVTDKDSEETAEVCRKKIAQYADLLLRADVRRVSIALHQEKQDDFEDYVPALFTFRAPDFSEDALFRRIDPSHAMHLDLNRVAENFQVRSLGSRHTSTSHVHLYEATPRQSAVAKDRKASTAPRVFVRALSFVLDFSSANVERILVDALNALDLSSSLSKADNHLFLNLVSDVEKTVIDPVVAEQIVVDVLKRHNDRVTKLGIVEVETKIVSCPNPEAPPISIRLVASNPTGYVQVMNTYVEAVNADSERVFKLIGGTKASMASSGDGSWDGLGVETPYPLTRPFDAQRKAALRSSDTLYCYDIPALFEAAVEQQWFKTSKEGTARPLMIMYTTELVVCRKSHPIDKKWTMKDYLDGNLELQHVNRGAGANDVGMVAWLVVLKTPEYPNGRQLVLIANDITFKAGSFGTREDVVFKLASEFARELRIPRLFIAANSGARIGLADRVKARYQVAFKNKEKPDGGFDFLYLTEQDYAELAPREEVLAEKDTLDGKPIYRITDIVGSEPDLGVENLKGSGLIAGETSAAYEDIFTMTIVLGRTVGIGAYLVRLGQRTIQKTTASPIILTGYQALNKLMGVDVYSTNDQLGGPGIMYSNGVSHVVASDHLGAIKAAMDWLAFVPSNRGGILPITDIRGVDSIDRPIGFTPSHGVPYDPRHLLTGCENDSGDWLSGFFDKGSFSESLAGWAKTVVVGRARLGGIPMGVVITENRTAENVKPADPADVKASEAIIQEAGCVWFPNSAYKTAQAIKDFRTEDLPLIVFANWRGFSGGQRDMFDEVLKYGSLIVDAFVSYQQPVFVFIPPFAEIRGGAWVVLDASINASVMEMYAAKSSARGGVLEANGAASVKYRTKDLIVTMHRLDKRLVQLRKALAKAGDVATKESLSKEIKARENSLLPVYEQIAVQFCELHDTPGRMKAVGVIEKEVEWEEARGFFYWRLRRKLAEFDLRMQILDASRVGRGVKAPSALEASAMIKQWFIESTKADNVAWADDKRVLAWMADQHSFLEEKILSFTKNIVVEEVLNVMTAGGNTARVGAAGIAEGISKALEQLPPQEREQVQHLMKGALGI